MIFVEYGFLAFHCDFSVLVGISDETAVTSVAEVEEESSSIASGSSSIATISGMTAAVHSAAGPSKSTSQSTR